MVAAALSWHAVVIPAGEIDRLGLHVCNIAGMRRALAGLSCRPGYVLTDGFPVRGLAVPALAMWKGDEVAACVAAASVVAKVTRDRLMTALDERYPGYGFAAAQGLLHPGAHAGAGRARAVPRAPHVVRQRERPGRRAGRPRLGIDAADLRAEVSRPAGGGGRTCGRSCR